MRILLSPPPSVKENVYISCAACAVRKNLSVDNEPVFCLNVSRNNVFVITSFSLVILASPSAPLLGGLAHLRLPSRGCNFLSYDDYVLERIAKGIYDEGMEETDQKDLKLNIKIWLKSNGYDYAWLANNCYVTESTVRNWMARKKIPKAKEHIIRHLIAQRPVVLPGAAAVTPPISVKAETLITFKLEQDVRRRLEEKAFKQGLTLEEFLTQTMSKLTEE